MMRYSYPNALLNQIVLVPLQLLLQAVRVDFCFLARLVNPRKVWNPVFVIWNYLVKLGCSHLVAPNIIASFCIFDG